MGEFLRSKQKEGTTQKIEMNVSRKDIKAEFRKHDQINLSETDVKQLLQLLNPIITANVEFLREENLRPTETSTLSKGLEEKL